MATRVGMKPIVKKEPVTNPAPTKPETAEEQPKKASKVTKRSKKSTGK